MLKKNVFCVHFSYQYFAPAVHQMKWPGLLKQKRCMWWEPKSWKPYYHIVTNLFQVTRKHKVHWYKGEYCSLATCIVCYIVTLLISTLHQKKTLLINSRLLTVWQLNISDFQRYIILTDWKMIDTKNWKLSGYLYPALMPLVQSCL